MSVPVADCVSLIEWPQGSGSPWVEYNGQLYGPREHLPFQNTNLAREYVASRMHREFGLAVNWPELAIEFVFPISED